MQKKSAHRFYFLFISFLFQAKFKSLQPWISPNNNFHYISIPWKCQLSLSLSFPFHHLILIAPTRQCEAHKSYDILKKAQPLNPQKKKEKRKAFEDGNVKENCPKSRRKKDKTRKGTHIQKREGSGGEKIQIRTKSSYNHYLHLHNFVWMIEAKEKNVPASSKNAINIHQAAWNDWIMTEFFLTFAAYVCLQCYLQARNIFF